MRIYLFLSHRLQDSLFGALGQVQSYKPIFTENKVLLLALFLV